MKSDNTKELINKLEAQNRELTNRLIEYKSIYNSSSDIILFVESCNGIIVNVNNAVTQLLGFTPDELIGNKIDLILNETTEEISSEIEIYGAVLTNRKIKKKDSKFRLMDMTFTMIEIGDAIFNIFNLRDAEERAKAEKELKDFSNQLEIHNKTKDKFFSIIAHDLKNPFSSLLGLSELLEADFNELTDEEKLSYIAEIRKVSKGSYQLLENLLHWSRAQTGKILYQPSELDLKFLVMEVMGLIYGQAKAKNIEIEINFNEDYVIYADDDLLMTVIRNLLTNAIKYSYNNQKIIIGANVIEEKTIELSITDFGIGIADNLKEKIFTINRGESRPGTNNEKGTGLGLILCKEFIELNKGNIRFESLPNIGTTFYITIPLLFF
ncbi:MAG TPA: PAS domain-containing sensor histidine kinase [Melioribacteraceae bacterium]|nr:PAS domain-containing sensor histidine kinase [Melioribacteraceae bacterium]